MFFLLSAINKLFSFLIKVMEDEKVLERRVKKMGGERRGKDKNKEKELQMGIREEKGTGSEHSELIIWFKKIFKRENRLYNRIFCPATCIVHRAELVNCLHAERSEMKNASFGISVCKILNN